MNDIKQYSVQVVNNRNTVLVEEPWANIKWDRGTTETDHEIVGFKVFDEDQFFDILVDFEPAFDTTYYLLYVVYSAGDSFGWDRRCGIEYIGLYDKDSYYIAEENKDRLESVDRGHYHRGRSYPVSVLLRSPNGEEFLLGVPWQDYFSSFDFARIVPVRRLP